MDCGLFQFLQVFFFFFFSSSFGFNSFKELNFVLGLELYSVVQMK